MNIYSSPHGHGNSFGLCRINITLDHFTHFGVLNEKFNFDYIFAIIASSLLIARNSTVYFVE